MSIEKYQLILGGKDLKFIWDLEQETDTVFQKDLAACLPI